MSINVVNTSLCIEEHIIEKESPIMSIYKGIREEDKVFIFHNEILAGSRSFSSYNIESDNIIVVVEPSVFKTIEGPILDYYKKCVLIGQVKKKVLTADISRDSIKDMFRITYHTKYQRYLALVKSLLIYEKEPSYDRIIASTNYLNANFFSSNYSLYSFSAISDCFRNYLNNFHKNFEQECQNLAKKLRYIIVDTANIDHYCEDIFFPTLFQFFSYDFANKAGFYVINCYHSNGEKSQLDSVLRLVASYIKCDFSFSEILGNNMLYQSIAREIIDLDCVMSSLTLCCTFLDEYKLKALQFVAKLGKDVFRRFFVEFFLPKLVDKWTHSRVFSTFKFNFNEGEVNDSHLNTILSIDSYFEHKRMNKIFTNQQVKMFFTNYDIIMFDIIIDNTLLSKDNDKLLKPIIHTFTEISFSLPKSSDFKIPKLSDNCNPELFEKYQFLLKKAKDMKMSMIDMIQMTVSDKLDEIVLKNEEYFYEMYMKDLELNETVLNELISNDENANTNLTLDLSFLLANLKEVKNQIMAQTLISMKQENFQETEELKKYIGQVYRVCKYPIKRDIKDILLSSSSPLHKYVSFNAVLNYFKCKEIIKLSKNIEIKNHLQTRIRFADDNLSKVLYLMEFKNELDGTDYSIKNTQYELINPDIQQIYEKRC